MLEKQFVTFITPDTINDQREKTPIMPLVPGSTGLEFYTPDAFTDSNAQGVTVSIMSPDLTYTFMTNTISSPTDNHITIGAETGGLFTEAAILATMGYGTAFRFYYSYKKAMSPYASVDKVSQVFCLADNRRRKLALLRYRCGTETGGIPYQNGQYVSAWMPIWLDKPQLKQESEIYTRLDGSTAVLFATATKEYEAQTDYLPYEWHDKIVNALMSDEVFINGEALQKSDDYDIKWENTETRMNRIRLAKAEWKMKACTLTRNTNL